MAEIEVQRELDVTIHVEVYCRCGNELDIETVDTSDDPKYPISVTITLCETCLAAEYQRGVKDAEHGMGV